MSIINVLGKRRLIIIAALTVCAGILAYVSYQYFAPKIVDYTRKRSRVQSQISAVRADYRRAVDEFEMLLERKGEFQSLIANNIINGQDRRNARNILSSIQSDSGVIFAKAAVGILENENNELLDKAKFNLNKSSLAVEIQSFDDLEFYEYMHLLKTRLPGIVTIDQISIVRDRGLSAVLLRQIADGEKPVMMTASVEATWISISSQEENAEDTP